MFPRPRKEILSSEEFLEAVSYLHDSSSDQRSAPERQHGDSSSDGASDEGGQLAGGVEQAGCPEGMHYYASMQDVVSKKGPLLGAIAEVSEENVPRSSTTTANETPAEKMGEEEGAKSSGDEGGTPTGEEGGKCAANWSNKETEREVKRKSSKWTDLADDEKVGFKLLCQHYTEGAAQEGEDGPPVTSLFVQQYSQIILLLNNSINNITFMLDIESSVFHVFRCIDAYHISTNLPS